MKRIELIRKDYSHPQDNPYRSGSKIHERYGDNLKNNHKGSFSSQSGSYIPKRYSGSNLALH